MKILLLAIPLVLTGCVHKQVIAKSTVVGIQATVMGYGQVQVGVCRNEYISNPTGTNITAAPLTTHVNASLNPINQTAVEDITTK